MAMLRRACVATVGLLLVCAGVIYGLYPEAVMEQYKVSSEAAQLKFELLCESALSLSHDFSTRVGEHSEVARVRLQDLKAKLQPIVEDPEKSMHEFSAYSSRVYYSGLDTTRALYASGSESARALYAVGLNSTRVLAARISEVGVAEVARQFQAEYTPAQLGLFAVGLIATLIATVLVVVRSLRLVFRVLCCRRHMRQQAVESADVDVETEIMKAPTPLRQAALRRRSRNDSPAPVARKGDAAAQPGESDLMNTLNTGTRDDLEALQGLGGKSIDRLLKHRKSGAPLENVGDLVTKVGIHPATYANFTKAQGL